MPPQRVENRRIALFEIQSWSVVSVDVQVIDRDGDFAGVRDGRPGAVRPSGESKLEQTAASGVHHDATLTNNLVAHQLKF